MGLQSPVELLALLWKEWEAYYVFSRMTALFKSVATKKAFARFYPSSCCRQSLFLLV